MESNPIISEDFLLRSEVAKELFYGFALKQPIIDYHCHLAPRELAEDFNFQNLTKIWLEGDHYKWRAMRANGVSENLITGKATDEEKFMAWAGTVPAMARNPLFHWTHLELHRYFGVTELLSAKTAGDVYEECSARLQDPEFSTRQIPVRMGVEVICTTDDPCDSLAYHQQLASFNEVKVLPTFRPDQVLRVDDPEFFQSYLEKLRLASDVDIQDLDSLHLALGKRIDFFHEQGCRLSDHGLNYLYAHDYSETEVAAIFQKAIVGKPVEGAEANRFRSYVLHELGKRYHEKNWVQQFHLGPLRNTNSRKLKEIGPDCGVDSIGDYPQAEMMARYFDALDREDKLAKTILYNINPSQNEVFATMAGNFQDGSIPGKIQYGSGWWFLDQKDGMEKQLNALSNMGLLSRFVGMLTDSRSFMSYPRHEYFRRILCNLLAEDVVHGELPHDISWLGKMVKDICYRNAKNYFDF